jgi:hypothetical protein
MYKVTTQSSVFYHSTFAEITYIHELIQDDNWDWQLLPRADIKGMIEDDPNFHITEPETLALYNSGAEHILWVITDGVRNIYDTSKDFPDFEKWATDALLKNSSIISLEKV